MSFKKCKVVMLSTNEKAQINQLYFEADGNLNICSKFTRYPGEISQHLYITSDEEIKIDEYYYNIPRNEIQQCESELESNSLKHNPKLAKKVIASTDIYCRIGINTSKPSQQFIEKYIEEYNKGNIITDVLVEYDEFVSNNGCNLNDGWHYGIKINKKDNTITIKKVKESWSKEELLNTVNYWFEEPDTNIILNKINNWVISNL